MQVVPYPLYYLSNSTPPLSFIYLFDLGATLKSAQGLLRSGSGDPIECQVSNRLVAWKASILPGVLSLQTSLFVLGF